MNVVVCLQRTPGNRDTPGPGSRGGDIPPETGFSRIIRLLICRLSHARIFHSNLKRHPPGTADRPGHRHSPPERFCRRIYW